MVRLTITISILVLCGALLLPVNSRAADNKPGTAETIVGQAVRPVMEQYGVPGMAVGVFLQGRSYVYNYGVASKATGKPVTSATLFEIGSLSKTFTATLASYAQVSGKLALSDMTSQYMPSLRGSNFDNVTLLDLGTHTSGGLPLQVPRTVTNNAQLMAYFRSWTPPYTPGTYRMYSNVSIGLLGMITAKSMNADFVTLMQSRLFPALGLTHTYIDVPQSQAENYAQGYTTADTPIRMTAGVLWAEAYGIRTTASDMVRFIAANMRMVDVDATLQRAMTATHTGYYRIGGMTQDLIWEQYHDPVGLQDLLAGNNAKVLLQANPAMKLDPPLQPRDDVLINKTGSTNGFSAYVAFIPARKIGIVLLANKSYPIDARVTAAYSVLTRLADAALKD